VEPHPVTITSRDGARNILTSAHARRFQALVSIGHQVGGDGEEFPVGYREFASNGRQVKHRMNVGDIPFLEEGWQNWSKFHSAPMPHDVEELIDFFPHIEGAVLFHCFAGMSRSPAAALLYLAWALGPDREAEAVARLHEIKPRTTPNYLMVAEGDVLLRRGRRLFEAVAVGHGWDRYPELAVVYDQAKALVRGGDIPYIADPG
jgi:predicted protein tyrosine phosphatase